MQWLASISVRRPIFATVLILAVVVVGIVGYGSLNVDRFPNVDLPIVSIVTRLPGAAPQEVRDHLATGLSDLPQGIESPVVSKLDPDAAPVLFVAIETKRPIRDATELADKKIRHALENISGVGQVTIVGGRKRQIQVFIDPIKLRAVNLTAADVQRAIASQNLT